MKLTKIAILIGSLILPTFAHGQAFGVEQGQTLDGLKATEFDKHIYEIKPPVPHRDFDLYSVRWTQETGVCSVLGETPYIDNEKSGITVRKKFLELKESLDRKYGEGVLSEAYLSRFYAENQAYWVSGLSTKEVLYFATWSASGTEALPDNLSSIQMEILAKDYDTTYITLYYTFSNYERCTEIIDVSESQGL